MANIGKIRVGQHVILTIGANGCIEGEYSGRVSVINKERTRVHLKNVIFMPTNHKFSGAKLFYLPEILSIEIISDVDDDDSGIERTTDTSSDDHIEFELNTRERQLIESRIANRSIIESVGDEFDRALEDISHYYFVGLAAGIGKRENEFVVCSTPHKIYMFNIKAIGAINDEFKEWFESDTHMKVIHGANLLEENLSHYHGIRIKGVFDTKVALKRFKSHFEVPPELDCSNALQIGTLIDKAAILLKFHDFLTQHLLRNAYQSFQLNVDYCRNKSSLEVQAIYRDGKSIVNDITNISVEEINVWDMML